MKGFLRVLYQPYKWLIFIPLLALSTLILGSLAVVLGFIVRPKTAALFTGVPWTRFNARITPVFLKIYGRAGMVMHEPIDTDGYSVKNLQDLMEKSRWIVSQGLEV